jgi:hypothetical protein
LVEGKKTATISTEFSGLSCCKIQQCTVFLFFLLLLLLLLHVVVVVVVEIGRAHV